MPSSLFLFTPPSPHKHAEQKNISTLVQELPEQELLSHWRSIHNRRFILDQWDKSQQRSQLQHSWPFNLLSLTPVQKVKKDREQMFFFFFSKDKLNVHRSNTAVQKEQCIQLYQMTLRRNQALFRSTQFLLILLFVQRIRQ